MFCYLWTDKKTNEPYILMVEGNHLHHKALQQGNRAHMKILPVPEHQDIDLETIGSILQDALDLYRDGTIKS